MNMRSMVQSVGVLATVTLLSVGSAQACMPGMMGQLASPGCKTQEGSGKSCPTQAAQADQGRACSNDRQDMAQAMGGMASSGMEMAAKIMRAVSEGLDSRIGPNPGI
jgi:hypothetical protein